MPLISEIKGYEILDSRGVPALKVSMCLDQSIRAFSCVPSGASTGRNEALELRDGDPGRFFGKGLLKSLRHLEDLSDHLKGYRVTSLEAFDQSLIDLDGTSNKSRLGANTLLALSLACARALACHQGKALFESMGGGDFILPVPMVNVLNGGVHASNALQVQEFMIVPYGFSSFKEAIRAASEVFHFLRQTLKAKNLSVAVGDEGGFAPQLANNEEAVKLLIQAIEKAGYSSEKQVGLALDVASSEFYREGRYIWEGGEKLFARDMISIYRDWLKHYPILSIEDGLAEDDWEGWKSLSCELGKKVQLLGDDIFVTQIPRLKKGIEWGVGNALLAKINQVGTLTQTFQAIQMAHREAYACCVSHRSGETEDTSIADLSVAWGSEQIKAGSVCRGERTAKYNRLLTIEEQLAHKAAFAGSSAFALLKS